MSNNPDEVQINEKEEGAKSLKVPVPKVLNQSLMSTEISGSRQHSYAHGVEAHPRKLTDSHSSSEDYKDELKDHILDLESVAEYFRASTMGKKQLGRDVSSSEHIQSGPKLEGEDRGSRAPLPGNIRLNDGTIYNSQDRRPSEPDQMD